MKRARKSLSVAAFVVFSFVAGIGVTGLVTAQEAGTDGVLVQKIDALVEQLAALAKVQSAETDGYSEPEVGFSLQNSLQDKANPDCLDNYQSWPTSLTQKTGSQWDITSFPKPLDGHYSQLMRPMVDINGDGLVDYVHYMSKGVGYSSRYGIPSYNNAQGCVMLNNGVGWDVVYKCVTALEVINGVKTVKYYGDCAQA